MSTQIDWYIALLRATAFLDTSEVAIGQLWPAVFGQDPSSINQNLEQKFSAGSGETEFGSVEMRIVDGRADLFLKPKPLTSGGGLANAGLMADIFPLFVDAASKWVEELSAKAVSRVAVGGALFTVTEDQAGSIATLKSQSPSLAQLDHIGAARDLIFQANFRKNSRVESDLTINRITKWLCAEESIVEFSPTKNVVRNSDVHSARCEFDFNCAPVDSLGCPADVFTECSELVADMSRNGEPHP